MAEKFQIDRGDFELQADWPAALSDIGEGGYDASFGRFHIRLTDKSLTAYRSDSGESGTAVDLPTYPIAEWLATNWWSILFEPRKTETEDAGFRERHWLGAVRRGFALPDMWIVPVGEQIEISAEEQYLRFARLAFLETGQALVKRGDVEQAMRSFVASVLDRITTTTHVDTFAHQAWRRIQETSPEMHEYCRLMGALGLSPYDDHGSTDELIDQLYDTLERQVLDDLCQAADQMTLPAAAGVATSLYGLLATAAEIDISLLDQIELPPDTGGRAWRRGVEASVRIRQQMGISSRDPKGGQALFDTLGIETSSGLAETTQTQQSISVTAAVKRVEEPCMTIALAERREPQRRFSAARAAYLAWSEKRRSTRLVTDARTREQQSSRAFAAELLAPIAYIRSRSGGSTMSMYRIDEIADELQVSPAVVRYQARNNRIAVTDIGRY